MQSLSAGQRLATRADPYKRTLCAKNRSLAERAPTGVMPDIHITEVCQCLWEPALRANCAQCVLPQPGQCSCKVYLGQNCVGARSASDFGFRAQSALSQPGQCICKVYLGQNCVGARSASDLGFRAQCVLSQPGQCICKVCLRQNYVGARSASEWPKKDPRGVRPPRVKKTM